ncbi:Hsp70 family protein [Endozoicomonas sp. ONNA1]|uniref:Hsp70 family protein n=1 Tax=Endozoicomonas sp. ONNA1 TaxID=2828740 RepID=UPI002147E13C|nr:Hsp70 family protein [Endozoicomonas sp. ONNA1]
MYPSAKEGFQSPTDIASHILQYLISKTSINGHTVITVPASFGESQRRATKAAAQIAGIEVSDEQLLDEPIAAFIDYLHSHQIKLINDTPQNLMVIDFGGGTCDVALFRVLLKSVSKLEVAPLSVSRYHRLGGGDIDRAIVYKILIPQLLKQNNMSEQSIGYLDKKKMLEPVLISIAEKLKKGVVREVERLEIFDKLNDASDNDIFKSEPGTIKLRLGPLNNLKTKELSFFKPTLSYGDLKKVLFDFLDTSALITTNNEYYHTQSIFSPIRSALEQAYLNQEEIDFVLSVGGSSVLPGLNDKYKSFFRNADLICYQNADESKLAISRGAALQSLSQNVNGCGLVTNACYRNIYLATTTEPLQLIQTGANLPTKQWSSVNISAPKTEKVEKARVSVELLDEFSEVLCRQVGEIPPPVMKGEYLKLEYYMDSNHLLHMQIVREESGGVIELIPESPWSHVENPNVDLEQAEQLEQKISSKQFSGIHEQEARENLAKKLIKIGQIEKAIDQYSILIRKVDSYKTGKWYNALASLYDEVHAFQKAEQHYIAAINSPDFEDAGKFNMALFYRRHKRYKEAISILNEATEYDPEPPFMVLKGMIFRGLGEKAKAQSCLSEAKESWLMELVDDKWTLYWMKLAAKELNDETLHKELKKIQPNLKKDNNEHASDDAQRPIARK